jgi:cell division protein FtsZ
MRAAQKPIIRSSAAVASAPAAVQPAMMTQAPRTAPVDPIAETIRQAEAQMERELAMPAMHQPAPQPAPVAEEFRPQSRLFQPSAPAEPVISRPAPAPAPSFSVQPQPAPVMQQPAPVMQQPAPVMQSAPVAPQPAPRMSQPIEAPAPMLRSTADQVRMPKIDDFSPVVKAEMDHRSQPVQHAAEERGPMGLLKRITKSLGRREDEDNVSADMTSQAPNAASQQRRPLSPEASLYAPRRGNLDDHGRAVPSSSAHHEDDQLEIPAFLRRQST